MFDFVLVEFEPNGKQYLFRAPAFTIEKGNNVLVEGGDKIATVTAVYTVTNGNKMLMDLIIRASGSSTAVKKVLHKVIYRELSYEEAEIEQLFIESE